MRTIALILGAVISMSCAGGPAASSVAAPPPAPAPKASPDGLREPGARRIHDVSPDGRRALVSHQAVKNWPFDAGDLALVTEGEPTRTLVAHGAAAAQFSPDGSAIVFDSMNGRQRDVNLARADGSGVRQLSAKSALVTFAGRWLYYSDESAGPVAFYRVLPPDGAPELIATLPPRDSQIAFEVWPSPDGERVAYCNYQTRESVDCFLYDGGTNIRFAETITFNPRWAPDGSWLVTRPCELVDSSGTARRFCDETLVNSAQAYDNRSTLAWFQAAAPGLEVHLLDLATTTETVLPPLPPWDAHAFRGAFELRFTPDGSRLLALLGASSFSIATRGISAQAASAGWTQISNDSIPDPRRGTAVVRADSRIIADTSESMGVIESIDGGPAHAVGPPGRRLFEASRPNFEPSGGLDKAVFNDSGSVWLANADGTGDWLQLSPSYGCEWAGRTALCLSYHDDPLSISSLDVTPLTDDGRMPGVLARDVVDYRVRAQKLFFVRSAGGLYVADVPR